MKIKIKRHHGIKVHKNNKLKKKKTTTNGTSNKKTGFQIKRPW